MTNREIGKYYTDYNPFKNKVFKKWFAKALKESGNVVLEPFAGENNLIRMLDKDYDFSYFSFDIAPGKDKTVIKRDTISDFPKGYKLAVTNPPYLSKVSATRLGMIFPKTTYDDLYKLSLRKMLDNCDYVAAIVPTTVLGMEEFRTRMESYILLNKKMFDTTDTPTCLALFSPEVDNTVLFDNNGKIGDFNSIISWFNDWSDSERVEGIKFNEREGSLFLNGIDNNNGPSIRFGLSNEMDPKDIKVSSRHKTLIKVPFNVSDEAVSKLNTLIEEYRENTKDVLMNSFMNIRKDGNFRRRLDYKTARAIIEKYISLIEKVS